MSIRHASEESVSNSSTAEKAYRKAQVSIPSKKIADVPGAPTVRTVTDVATGRAYNNAEASIAVNPSSLGGATTSYTATSNPDSISVTSSTSPIVVAGLSSNTSYTFNVVANSSSGASLPTASPATTVTSVPQAPTITSVIDNGSGAAFNNGSAKIAFTPGNSGGKSVTSFTVTSNPDNITSSGSSPITVSGLRSAVGYTYTITATNPNGTSAASIASSSVTSTTVPDAPIIGTASVTNSTTVSLSFTTPANGGLPITGYTVASTPSIALTVSGSSSPLTVTGNFLPSVFYTFTVTAVNANGASVTSAASNSIAPIPIITDNFNRSTSGSLGTSSSGGLWQAIKGVWFANNGVAQSNDAATNDSIAAVNLQSPLVTVSTANSSLGTGVAFMVQDSNNWWAAVGLENDTYTYAYTYTYTATGTGSHYTAPYTFYYTATGYGITGYATTNGVNYYAHYGSYTYTAAGSGGGTTSYYSYAYTTTGNPAPSSIAVTTYLLNVYRSVAGTVSTAASTVLSGLSSAVKVVVSGSTVNATAYSDNALTNSVGTATVTGVTPAGNLHGIILTPSTQNQGNTTGAFSAQVTG